MDFFQAIFFSKILKDNLKGLQTWAFFKGQCYQKSNLKLTKGLQEGMKKKGSLFRTKKQSYISIVSSLIHLSLTHHTSDPKQFPAYT